MELTEDISEKLTGKISVELMEARNSVKQREFAKKLKEIYKSCVICETEIPVEGAHIIPFCICENFDIHNGLLLCNNHHALFDKFLFTINPETFNVILTQEMIRDKNHAIYANKIISIPNEIEIDKLKNNLKYHYDKFVNSKKN